MARSVSVSGSSGDAPDDADCRRPSTSTFGDHNELLDHAVKSGGAARVVDLVVLGQHDSELSALAAHRALSRLYRSSKMWRSSNRPPDRSPNAPKRFAQGAKAMQEKNYSRARELIGELFLLDKEDNGAWYDLACIEALDGHPDKAIDCLKKAVDYGYANFRHIEHDPDLDSIRQSAEYKDLLAHKDQISAGPRGKDSAGVKGPSGQRLRVRYR